MKVRMGGKEKRGQANGVFFVKASLMKCKTPGYEPSVRGSREGLRGILEAQKEERSSGADAGCSSRNLQLSWNAGSAQTIPGFQPGKELVDQPCVKKGEFGSKLQGQ